MPWTPNPDDVEGEDLLYTDEDEPTALAWTDMDELTVDKDGNVIIYLEQEAWDAFMLLLEEDDDGTE